jgi:hypothetical protein
MAQGADRGETGVSGVGLSAGMKPLSRASQSMPLLCLYRWVAFYGYAIPGERKREETPKAQLFFSQGVLAFG